MKKTLIATLIALTSLSAMADDEINLYGPGGPHTALQLIAKAYTEKTGVPVKVNFGPQKKWNEEAKTKADILFGASEQSALAIATDHPTRFDEHQIEPVYLRRAIILVKKGNPKNIKGLKDLATMNVGVIAPDGAGKSNTSGTGVWEDMIGRTGDINLVRGLRSHIVSFTPNSGTARDMFLNDPKVDAWITWIDWAKSNPNFGEVVEIEPDLVVYRDMNLVARKDADKDVKGFIEFAKSAEAAKLVAPLGWTTQVQK